MTSGGAPPAPPATPPEEQGAPVCFICYEGDGVCNAPSIPSLEMMLPATADNDLPRNSSLRRGRSEPLPAAHSTAQQINMMNEQREDARLVSPCACRGSSAYVHVGCLKSWHGQQTSHVNQCPTCEQSYHGHVALLLARLSLQKVRALRRTIGFGEGEPAVDMCEAMSMDSVGQLLSAQGEHDAAMDLYQHSLVSKVAIQGTEATTIANSLDNIAEVFRIQGYYPDALALKKEALRIRNKSLGPSHTDTATSYNNIGLVMQNMGLLSEAKPYFQQAVATHEALNAHDSPNMAAMLNNLAGSYRFQGELEEAEALYERSLAMRIRVLGPERPAVAESYNNLAMVLKDAGKFQQAEAMSRRCQDIARKFFSPENTQFLNYMGNLGIVRMAMEMPEGRALVARALAGMLTAGLPETHVWVQKFRKHLSGGAVEPGTMLMPSGAVFACETARGEGDAQREGQAEGETNANNSSKQLGADATQFCPSHDARVGPSHASQSLAVPAERFDTPQRRLTRSASVVRMNKVLSAPALLPSPSEHDESSDVSTPLGPSVRHAIEALDRVTPGETPRDGLDSRTVTLRASPSSSLASGLRRVVSAAHLQSIANCRPEALETSAHPPSPLRDDSQSATASTIPRRSGSKRTRLDSLQEMDEDEEYGGRPVPRATAPTEFTASTASTASTRTYLRFDLGLTGAQPAGPMPSSTPQSEEAAALIAAAPPASPSEEAAAMIAAAARSARGAPVEEVFKQLLAGYHKRHQCGIQGL